MSDNLLLLLTPTQLEAIRGERRTRLMQYLATWKHSETALRYLEVWLGGAQQQVTLRQAHASTLLALGRPADALRELDEIDSERGVTSGRLRLRVDCLAGSCDWQAAHTLVKQLCQDDEWEAARLHSDLLLKSGNVDEAETTLHAAGFERESGELPVFLRARIAMARREYATVLRLLDTTADDDGTSSGASVARRKMVCEAAEKLGDNGVALRGQQELAELEAQQRAAVLQQLGLDERIEPTTIEPVADGPEEEPRLPEAAFELLGRAWGYDSTARRWWFRH
ncbi:MAG: hypothetical protein NVS4B8_09920 [Herpetosiphon sp.]